MNGYRIMWLIAVYDCPMVTAENRANYTRFRTLILRENFIQMQNSLYLRHFPTLATAEAAIERLSKHVPAKTKLAFFLITDKQYGMTRTYFGRAEYGKKPTKPEQVELF